MHGDFKVADSGHSSSSGSVLCFALSSAASHSSRV
jgi:hypothetical protein